MERLWEKLPSSERIVQDILHIPRAIEEIIEHKGAIVPDLDNRSGRRKVERPVEIHPDAIEARDEARARARELIKKQRGA